MCKNGEVTIIKGASYFICKVTGNACAFVRFCTNDNKLKPTENQEKCKEYK